MWKRSNSETQPDGTASADLLVIGGGILGLSTACEALSRGLSVTLFDATPEQSATRASAGMLSPYAEPAENGSLIDQMKMARAGYPDFIQTIEEASGCRIEIGFPGTLLTSLEIADSFRLRDLAARCRDMGAACQFLDAEEVTREEPSLTTKTAGSVLLCEEGYVNPRSLHDALRSAFDRLGGLWVPLPVIGLVARKQAVVGIETASGVTLGGAVLNATGAAVDLFLLPEDVARYRPRPVRGELIRLRPPSHSRSIRRVIQIPGYLYMVPQDDGTVICGATSQEDGPIRRTTSGGVRSILEATARVVPDSEEWAFVDSWNGLRPLAGDGDMMLIPDDRKGLFHGLGLYRHGVLLAPVASTKLCRMILEYLGRQG